jgi:hypothetical protein
MVSGLPLDTHEIASSALIEQGDDPAASCGRVVEPEHQI